MSGAAASESYSSLPTASGQAGDDGEQLRRAGGELLRRIQAGEIPTDATAAESQLKIGQILIALGRAVADDKLLPDDVLRHADDLARHVLDYPPASLPATAKPSSER